MGTNTISLEEEAYERLEAEKRDGESFSDTIKRLTSEVSVDWRHSIGTYSGEQAEAFAEAVHKSHKATNRGMAHRQQEANSEFACGREKFDSSDEADG